MPLRDIALLITVAVLWGGNFTVIKQGLAHSEPLALSTLRFLFAAIPACLLVPRPRIPVWRLLAIGMTLGTLMSGFQFMGMKAGVNASVTSVVLQSQAFMTIALALMLGETCTKRTWATIVFGCLGILCFVAEYWGHASVIGLFFVVVAAFWWALSNILLKGTQGVDPLGLIVWMSLVPILPLGALSLIYETGPYGPVLFQFTFAGLVAAFYLGIGVMIIGYGIWGLMLQRHRATQVAPFSLLVPVFGMAFGVLVLGEELTWLQIVGALFMMASVVVMFLPWQDIARKLQYRSGTQHSS